MKKNNKKLDWFSVCHRVFLGIAIVIGTWHSLQPTEPGEYYRQRMLETGFIIIFSDIIYLIAAGLITYLFFRNNDK